MLSALEEGGTVRTCRQVDLHLLQFLQMRQMVHSEVHLWQRCDGRAGIKFEYGSLTAKGFETCKYTSFANLRKVRASDEQQQL